MLCIGCLPAYRWNRNNIAQRENVRYTDRLKKKTCFCLLTDKNKSDDQTQRLIESGPQKAHDNALQPRERMKEKKKTVHETISLHTSNDFQTQCDEIASVFPAIAQARWMLWSFCFSINNVWLRSFTKYSFQYSPDEYLSISFTLCVCSEDYIINPRRTEDYGLWSNRLRRHSWDKLNWGHIIIGQVLSFDPLSRFIMASVACRSCSTA